MDGFKICFGGIVVPHGWEGNQGWSQRWCPIFQLEWLGRRNAIHWDGRLIGACSREWVTIKEPIRDRLSWDAWDTDKVGAYRPSSEPRPCLRKGRDLYTKYWWEKSKVTNREVYHIYRLEDSFLRGQFFPNVQYLQNQCLLNQNSSRLLCRNLPADYKTYRESQKYLLQKKQNNFEKEQSWKTHTIGFKTYIKVKNSKGLGRCKPRNVDEDQIHLANIFWSSEWLYIYIFWMFFFEIIFIFQLQLTYNIMLVSGVQHIDQLHNLQSDHPSKSHTHLTPHIVTTALLTMRPTLYLHPCDCFITGNFHILIPSPLSPTLSNPSLLAIIKCSLNLWMKCLFVLFCFFRFHI